MQNQGEPKPPPGVIYDSSFDDGVDQILALAELFGLESAREAKVASLSMSRPDLAAAALCDAIARFYGTDANGVGPRIPIPIGFPPSRKTVSTDPVAARVLGRMS